MKISNRKKGQTITEYALIAVTVVIALVAGSRIVVSLMSEQVTGTSKGFSSGSYTKKTGK